MEVKINIEAEQIGSTVMDLFKNLSDEKREELATEVVKKYLDEKVNQKYGSWQDQSILKDLNQKIENYFNKDIIENEKFQEAKKVAVEHVIQNLPEIMIKAMVSQTFTQLMGMQSQVTNAMLDYNYNKPMITQMKQRLGMP